MMTMKRKASLVAVLCAAGSALILVRTAQAQAAVSAVGQHLEGAWQLTNLNGTLTNMTLFTADGSMIAVPAPRTTSAAMGSWIRTGDHQFAVTQYRFNYDANGTLIGAIKIRWNMTLNDTLDGFTAAYRMDTLDLNGNVLSSGAGTLVGKRINVEPLE